MDNMNAINTRMSRRVYLDEEVSSDKVDLINNEIVDLNKVSGMNIVFINDGSKAFSNTKVTYGMFKNVRSVILLKGSKTDENLLEKAGYYGEKLVLLATQLGLGSCWVGGTYSKSDFLSYVSDDEELVCTITIGYTKDNLNFKESIVRKAFHRKSKNFEDIYESDIEISEEIANALTSVLKAPSAMNKQDFLIKNNGSVITFETTRLDDSGFIDLGIAKLHFELSAGGKFELGNKGIYHSN